MAEKLPPFTLIDAVYTRISRALHFVLVSLVTSIDLTETVDAEQRAENGKEYIRERAESFRRARVGLDLARDQLKLASERWEAMASLYSYTFPVLGSIEKGQYQHSRALDWANCLVGDIDSWLEESAETCEQAIAKDAGTPQDVQKIEALNPKVFCEDLQKILVRVETERGHLYRDHVGSDLVTAMTAQVYPKITQIAECAETLSFEGGSIRSELVVTGVSPALTSLPLSELRLTSPCIPWFEALVRDLFTLAHDFRGIRNYCPINKKNFNWFGTRFFHLARTALDAHLLHPEIEFHIDADQRGQDRGTDYCAAIAGYTANHIVTKRIERSKAPWQQFTHRILPGYIRFIDPDGRFPELDLGDADAPEVTEKHLESFFEQEWGKIMDLHAQVCESLGGWMCWGANNTGPPETAHANVVAPLAAQENQPLAFLDVVGAFESGEAMLITEKPPVPSPQRQREIELNMIENEITGKGVKLFRVLRKTTHFVSYDTLLDEYDPNRSNQIGALLKALKRLKSEQLIDTKWDMEIDHENRRAKLFRLTDQGPDK